MVFTGASVPAPVSAAPGPPTPHTPARVSSRARPKREHFDASETSTEYSRRLRDDARSLVEVKDDNGRWRLATLRRQDAHTGDVVVWVHDESERDGVGDWVRVSDGFEAVSGERLRWFRRGAF